MTLATKSSTASFQSNKQTVDLQVEKWGSVHAPKILPLGLHAHIAWGQDKEENVKTDSTVLFWITQCLGSGLADRLGMESSRTWDIPTLPQDDDSTPAVTENTGFAAIWDNGFHFPPDKEEIHVLFYDEMESSNVKDHISKAKQTFRKIDL